MRQDFYKQILDSLFDGVYFVDNTRTITFWNKGAERISGFNAAEVLGRGCADNLLMHVDDFGTQLCRNSCPLAATLQDGQSREAEVFLHHKDGHRVPVNIRIAPMRDETGKIVGAVEIFTDSTLHREMVDEIKELEQMTLVDPLTGLGNRRDAALDFERKSKALRHFNVPFGLLFVDIDNFKDVNDEYGHEVGDRVLTTVGKPLSNALRGKDRVCRWGGEEFVAMVSGVDVARFRAIAERMRRLVETSALPVPGGMLRVSVSIGGSIAEAQDTMDTLVKRADEMMYRAKLAGRNCTALDCS